MRAVEYHRYWLPSLGGKRPHLSRWAMTAEDAAARGALRPEPGTREVRMLAETSAEASRMGHNQSAGHDGARGRQ